MNRNGLRYLGSIAVQGGLPARLLEFSGNHISNLLLKVLEQGRGKEIFREMLRVWVKEYGNLLPATYSEESIFDLLTDFALEAIQIGLFIKNTKPKDVIEMLDREKPEWRSAFPVSIRDQGGRRFVEHFVKKVKNLEHKPVKRKATITRMLKEEVNGSWQIRSEFGLTEDPSFEDLGNLFPEFKKDCAAQGYPRKLNFEMQSGAAIHNTKLQKLAGPPNYRFLKVPDMCFSGDDALGEHLIRLNTNEGLQWTSLAPKGEGLDYDLPWFFIEEGDYVRANSSLDFDKNWRYWLGVYIPLKFLIERDEKTEGAFNKKAWPRAKGN